MLRESPPKAGPIEDMQAENAWRFCPRVLAEVLGRGGGSPALSRPTPHPDIRQMPPRPRSFLGTGARETTLAASRAHDSYFKLKFA